MDTVDVDTSTQAEGIRHVSTPPLRFQLSKYVANCGGHFALRRIVIQTSGPCRGGAQEEKKWASQRLYMMILMFINKTWGTASELMAANARRLFSKVLVCMRGAVTRISSVMYSVAIRTKPQRVNMHRRWQIDVN